MGKLCQCLVVSTPKKCGGDTCVYAPNLLIKEQDSVTACGEAGIINIADKVNVNLCGKKSLAASYEIVSKSSNVDTVAINSTQIIFTLKQSELSTATIKYRVKCGIYSDSGEILIVVKKECNSIICPEGFVCKECEGCVEIVGDLQINANNPFGITPNDLIIS